MTLEITPYFFSNGSRAPQEAGASVTSTVHLSTPTVHLSTPVPFCLSPPRPHHPNLLGLSHLAQQQGTENVLPDTAKGNAHGPLGMARTD